MGSCTAGSNARNLRLAIPIVTILVSIFDLSTDWWAFQRFVIFDGGKLMIALAVICSLSTLLFFGEVYDGLRMFVFRSKRSSRIRASMKASRGEQNQNLSRKTEEERKEENKIERLHEALTFLLLIVEDIPSVVILYFAFQEGNCNLFRELFEEGLVAYVSLFGSGLSALWKTLLSLVFCIQCCRFYDIKRCESKTVCCLCRLLRPLLALVFILFVSFFLANLYFDKQYKVLLGSFSLGLVIREDCINGTMNTTELPLLLTDASQ